MKEDTRREQFIAQLQSKLGEMSEDEQEALNEAVLGTSEEVASEANNGGVAAQLDYLLRNGWKPAEILRRVKDGPAVFTIAPETPVAPEE